MLSAIADQSCRRLDKVRYHDIIRGFYKTACNIAIFGGNIM